MIWYAGITSLSKIQKHLIETEDRNALEGNDTLKPRTFKFLLYHWSTSVQKYTKVLTNLFFNQSQDNRPLKLDVIVCLYVRACKELTVWSVKDGLSGNLRKP